MAAFIRPFLGVFTVNKFNKIDPSHRFGRLMDLMVRLGLAERWDVYEFAGPRPGVYTRTVVADEIDVDDL